MCNWKQLSKEQKPDKDDQDLLFEESKWCKPKTVEMLLNLEIVLLENGYAKEKKL